MESLRPRKVKLGSKPHLLWGTAVGTLAAFALFVRHYARMSQSAEQTWVWFGIRSDGKCGRDFPTDWGSDTGCGKGQCCSSHGWCGRGEEYCSVALGCQSGCSPASKADEAKRAEGEPHEGGAPDDHEYMDRMHHYKYDEDDHGHHGYHHRRYGGYNHDYHDDYHHRYDHHDDSYHDNDHHGMGHGGGEEHGGEEHGGVEHGGGEHGGGEHGEPDYDEGHPAHGGGHEHDPDYMYDHPDKLHHGHDGGDAEPQRHGGQQEADSDPGPELVGLEEKRHQGTGDGVPLHGEAHAS